MSKTTRLLVWLSVMKSCVCWVSPRTTASGRRILKSLSALHLHRKYEMPEASNAVARAALCGLLLLNPAPPAVAYDPSDFASETVTAAIQSLKEAQGSANSVVKAYESVAGIITEGKGIGGEINFKGVQLDRGYVADEDTAIYNPGLTLLTESEKERLVEAIVESKRASMSSWNADTQAGFEFLREKLDPLHTYELRGYLRIVPFYGAALYLAALAVQQIARDYFPVAYIAGVVAIFAPALALILSGP
jgi:hypothetical protein